MKFIKVKCLSCGDIRSIYKFAKTQVSCFSCTSALAKPQGGKCLILGRTLDEKSE